MTFAGRVPPAEIWRYYADADIYVQTPDIDNMPSSVLEAYASGCAVVATNAGGVPAILTDEAHGLLIGCNDPCGGGGGRSCGCCETSRSQSAWPSNARDSLRQVSLEQRARALGGALSAAGPARVRFPNRNPV